MPINNYRYENGQSVGIVNEQTGDYTLTSDDNGGIVVINSASDRTVTVPGNTLPLGFHCWVIHKGTGSVSFFTTNSTTVGGAKMTKGQYSVVGVFHETLDTFRLTGDIVEGLLPQNSKSADYTIVASDSGKHIFHPAADANNRTFTIPSNASVPFPIGTMISFVNESVNPLSIAITTDTLTLANSTTSGTRTLAENGVATAFKVTSTKWLISGSGLT